MIGIGRTAAHFYKTTAPADVNFEVTTYVRRYRGKWTKKDRWLEYWIETLRLADNEVVLVTKRVFRITDDGLLVYVFSNKSSKQVALYRHPEDIALPESAKAMIDDMAWLANAWTGMRRTWSIDPNRDLTHLTKKKETPLRRFGTNISAVSGLGCTPPRNLSEHGCARAEHDAIGSKTSEDNGAKDQVAGCQ